MERDFAAELRAQAVAKRLAFAPIRLRDVRQVLFERARLQTMRGDRLRPRRAAQIDGLPGDHATPRLRFSHQAPAGIHCEATAQMKKAREPGLMFASRGSNPLRHHTTFFSTIGRFSSTRDQSSDERSSVLYLPFKISSLTPRPVAGPCCRPCPLKPLAKTQFSIAG